MIRLALDADRLGALFPAFLHVDAGLRVCACGPTLARLVPSARAGARLDAVFLEVPDLARHAAAGDPLQVAVADPPLQLRGIVLELEDGFLLALNVIAMTLPAGPGALRIDDFAADDPAVAAMMLAGVQAALIAESRAIALDLAAERQRTVALLERVTAAAAHTAHELNNVVSTIGLTCERLLRVRADAGEIAEQVGVIRRTALRGAALTRAMMDLAERAEEPERIAQDDGTGAEGASGGALSRVLVVEDEPHALEALAELLGDLGYAVTACATAEAALVALETGRFDLLLTDVVLPAMSGLDLAGRAQAQPFPPAIVLMSGYLPEGGEVREGWQFLRKPLDIARLDGVLRGRRVPRAGFSAPRPDARSPSR